MNRYVIYGYTFFTDLLAVYNHNRNMKKKIDLYPELSIGEKFHKFRDCAHSKRCFIIGNGPSLKAEDLTRIQEEDTFASNGIWGIFNKTNWRPKYYFIGDPNYAKSIGDNIEIPMQSAEAGFFVLTHLDNYPEVLKTMKTAFFYYQPIPTIFNEILMKFGKSRISKDISKICFSCGTITFEMLQVAIYMGYSEIYLLGVDHTYRKKSHFADCRESGVNQDIDVSRWELGYLAAKRTAKRKGISILNATRGGELEVFPRVDFEKLILYPRQ